MINCNDLVQTHYYRDIKVSAPTPEETAIAELQKEVEELTTDVTDLNSFKESFVIVYPTDTDEVVQQKINTPNVSKIIFAKGTYNNITTTKNIPSNKTLIGYGATIVAPSSIEWIVFQNDANGTIGGYNANENITILGFDFNGENLLSGQGASIMGFIHCNHIIVKDCKFRRLWTGGHFIELNACHACVVDSCYFYDYTGTEMVQLDQASDVGTYPVIPNGPWDGTGCSAITITNCTFENPQAYTAEHGADTFPAGIGIHNKNGNNSTHIKVVGNTFATITTALRFVKVASSVFNNNTAYGIYNFFSVATDSNAAITANFAGNVISGNTINCAAKIASPTVVDSYKYTAITYNGTNSIIANNQIWNATADGIAIRGNDNTISNNRISYCGRSGISLITTTNTNVIGNNCTSNKVSNVEAFDADIRVSGTTTCNINTNTTSSLNVNATGNTLIMGNIITGALNNTGGTAHNNMINGAWTA